jgi:CPA2 family monovalent cation:H+ antiporter-2
MLLFLSEISITNAFIPLIILLGISALIAVVLSVFKLSLVPNFVLEILIGMILGVWYNDFSIQHGFESVNNIVYTLGLVFLLFLSGLDIDYKVFKNSHDAPTKDVSVVKLSILLIAGIYLLSIILL